METCPRTLLDSVLLAFLGAFWYEAEGNTANLEATMRDIFGYLLIGLAAIGLLLGVTGDVFDALNR
jgi:hypothetical protein